MTVKRYKLTDLEYELLQEFKADLEKQDRKLVLARKKSKSLKEVIDIEKTRMSLRLGYRGIYEGSAMFNGSEL